jgi:hypothetical protein
MTSDVRGRGVRPTASWTPVAADLGAPAGRPGVARRSSWPSGCALLAGALLGSSARRRGLSRPLMPRASRRRPSCARPAPVRVVMQRQSHSSLRGQISRASRSGNPAVIEPELPFGHVNPVARRRDGHDAARRRSASCGETADHRWASNGAGQTVGTELRICAPVRHAIAAKR